MSNRYSNKRVDSALGLYQELKFMHNRRDRSYGRDFVYVDTATRRDFLTSQNQGKITLSATVYNVVFENMGGGVWKASVDYEQES